MEDNRPLLVFGPKEAFPSEKDHMQPLAEPARGCYNTR